MNSSNRTRISTLIAKRILIETELLASNSIRISNIKIIFFSHLLINAPTDYKIYVTDDLTYYSIKKRSNYDPNFKKLLNRLKPVTVLDFFGFSIGSKFYYRKCAGLTTSIKWELQKEVRGNEVVIDEIRYDHMLNVKFIRKDFLFSDRMVLL